MLCVFLSVVINFVTQNTEKHSQKKIACSLWSRICVHIPIIGFQHSTILFPKPRREEVTICHHGALVPYWNDTDHLLQVHHHIILDLCTEQQCFQAIIQVQAEDRQSVVQPLLPSSLFPMLHWHQRHEVGGNHSAQHKLAWVWESEESNPPISWLNFRTTSPAVSVSDPQQGQGPFGSQATASRPLSDVVADKGTRDHGGGGGVCHQTARRDSWVTVTPDEAFSPPPSHSLSLHLHPFPTLFQSLLLGNAGIPLETSTTGLTSTCSLPLSLSSHIGWLTQSPRSRRSAWTGVLTLQGDGAHVEPMCYEGAAVCPGL